MYCDIKKRNKFGKIAYSWPVLVLVAGLIILIGKNVFEVYKNEKTSRVNQEKSEEVFTSLENRSNLIATEIAALKTEKGIETEIRDKFRVVKEGEQLVVIINSDQNKNNNSVSDKTETLLTKIIQVLTFWKQ